MIGQLLSDEVATSLGKFFFGGAGPEPCDPHEVLHGVWSIGRGSLRRRHRHAEQGAPRAAAVPDSPATSGRRGRKGTGSAADGAARRWRVQQLRRADKGAGRDPAARAPGPRGLC